MTAWNGEDFASFGKLCKYLQYCVARLNKFLDKILDKRLIRSCTILQDSDPKVSNGRAAPGTPNSLGSKVPMAIPQHIGSRTFIVVARELYEGHDRAGLW